MTLNVVRFKDNQEICICAFIYSGLFISITVLMLCGTSVNLTA